MSKDRSCNENELRVILPMCNIYLSEEAILIVVLHDMLYISRETLLQYIRNYIKKLSCSI